MNICKVREVNGKDYTYRGEVNENGFFHGLGEIHFKNSKYEGEFNNGNMTGQGVYENYLNSIIYDGNFLNGNLHGYCLITFKNMSLHAYYDNGKLIKSKSISKDGFLYKEYDNNTKIYSIKFINNKGEVFNVNSKDRSVTESSKFSKKEIKIANVLLSLF